MTILDDKWDWVGSIEVASGEAVDVFNIQPDMLDINDIARSLSLICRFNGHLPGFYSVAEHSVRVSWHLKELGFNTNVQLTGLLHDGAEAYVGDMMRPLKQHHALGPAFRRVEDAVSRILHETLGGTFPHGKAVGSADREVYNWEVENIRTGLQRGWNPDIAMLAFLDEYRGLISA